MTVEHTLTEEIHKGTKGGIIGCGFDTTLHSNHWVSVSAEITCDKNGCKN